MREKSKLWDEMEIKPLQLKLRLAEAVMTLKMMRGLNLLNSERNLKNGFLRL